MIKDVRVYPSFMAMGKETVTVKAITDRGTYSASVPSGTSRGSHEAKEFTFAKVKSVLSEIRHEFIRKPEDWQKIDEFILKLDGTKDFSRIGMNLALGISIAVARAQTFGELWKLNNSELRKAVFPHPLGNIIGGGQHGGGTDWQEFLFLDYMSKSPYDAVERMIEMWSSVGDELARKKLLVGRNLENAWMAIMDEYKTLDFLSEIASDWSVKLGIDFAASSLWNGKKYVYKKSGKELTKDQHMDFIEDVAKKYNIYYLEDPFEENDYESFSELKRTLPNGHHVIGDDLYVTNAERFKKGIEENSSHGIIIKPNQVGTLIQTKQVVDLCHEHKQMIVPSHRSGETTDPWLADLAIAWNAHIIKISSSGVDLAKHNRLIDLWNEIPHVEMAQLP